MAEPNVEIREASTDDIEGILSVMKAALGEPPGLRRTRQLYDWKHVDNPWGPSIVLVAEVGSRIVAVRAFMRWDLKSPSGYRVRCGRAVDTATHPDFQGLGIFRSLTLSALELARERDIDLIFNTPNEKSAPGYLKMGWFEVGWVGPLVKPRFGRAIHADAGQAVTLVETLPDARPFQPTDLRAGADASMATERSEEFQRWRFTGHPTARYGWWSDGKGGAVVRSSVRNGRTEMLAVDFSPDTDRHLFRGLARANRARYAAAAFTPSASELPSARRARWFRPPGQRGLRLVANQLSDIEVDPFEIASWDLTLSDLELL